MPNVSLASLIPHLADVGVALLDGDLARADGVEGGRVAVALKVGAVIRYGSTTSFRN